MAAYGIISSLRPLRKRMGIFVILEIVSSVGHIWWHRGARKRAGGKALLLISDVTQWVVPDSRWYKFSHGSKGIFQDDGCNVAFSLVPSS